MYWNKISCISLVFLLFPVASRCAEIVDEFGTGANQFSLSFMEISAPGNSPDTNGDPVPAGAVPYHYQMGKYEITRDAIEKANAEGGLGITLDPMGFIGDLIPVGPSSPLLPATGINWKEAARFVNWLNASKGFQVAYKFSAQPGEQNYDVNEAPGLWDLTESAADSRGVNRYRHKDARYVLPSVDEWYKAAYYDPTSDSYFEYATGSNDLPDSVASGTDAGTAVYGRPFMAGPAEVHLAGGASPFGVVGMEGNVWELEESAFQLASYNENADDARAIRGGFWFLGPMFLSSTMRMPFADIGTELSWVGFRVARVSTPALLVDSGVFYADWSGSGSGHDSTKFPHRQTETPTALTFQNVINTSAGITGVQFEIMNLAAPSQISAEDFDFRVSPQGLFDMTADPPGGWSPAPAAIAIQTTAGVPSEILVVWGAGQIENRWLRIEIKANSKTGLSQPEIFFLGHLRGEVTGPSGDEYSVSFVDSSAIRNSIGQPATVENLYDLDKNGSITFADVTSARSNVGTQLPNITVP